jgi:hypothetical protein
MAKSRIEVIADRLGNSVEVAQWLGVSRIVEHATSVALACLENREGAPRYRIN